jgi:hypothetical protein
MSETSVAHTIEPTIRIVPNAGGVSHAPALSSQSQERI